MLCLRAGRAWKSRGRCLRGVAFRVKGAQEIVDDVSRSTEKKEVMGMDGGTSCASHGLAPQTVRVKQQQ
jgi:hypothetical protein